jgi:hypothetical protein
MIITVFGKNPGEVAAKIKEILKNYCGLFWLLRSHSASNNRISFYGAYERLFLYPRITLLPFSPIVGPYPLQFEIIVIVLFLIIIIPCNLYELHSFHLYDRRVRFLSTKRGFYF